MKDMEVAQIAERLQTEPSGFRREVDLVYTTIVLPGWEGELHGLPRTLYGYMMATCSYVDLVSIYRYGVDGSQTERMRRLIVDYTGATAEAAAVCVQMWRHTLMHTANPRKLTETHSGKVYQWLLHWGPDHLPRDHHLRFQPGTQVLNVGLSYLLDDTMAASEKVFAEASKDARRKTTLMDAQQAIENQSFRI
jgi:hypothetical protein